MSEQRQPHCHILVRLPCRECLGYLGRCRDAIFDNVPICEAWHPEVRRDRGLRNYQAVTRLHKHGNLYYLTYASMDRRRSPETNMSPTQRYQQSPVRGPFAVS